jgi:NCAIR mutase (PurE)-related protein
VNADQVRNLLLAFQSGQASLEEAMEQLRTMPFEDLGYAKIDHHRAVRQGFPEVVYCEGKTVEQVASIIEHLAERNPNVLGTRASRSMFEAVKAKVSEACYHELARLICIERQPAIIEDSRFILVMTAGTSDMPIAEEAALTAEIMGNRVKRVYDVGVAGIHRLLAQREVIEQANVIVVAAGMEGALASVVGGMAAKPVISVPTSVGYGANFGGLAALLTMLNSCAAGVAVVNIDNGFGAGRLASMINKMR